MLPPKQKLQKTFAPSAPTFAPFALKKNPATNQQI
jgi:hypothetical protein